jgi:hypothetical protein
METRRLRWIVYTVMVGFIPIVSRGFAWPVTRDGAVEPVAASDFVALGLILQISTINEMEHANASAALRTVQHGLAVMFISIYSALYAFVLVGDTIVDTVALGRCAIGLALLSLFLNCTFYYFLGNAAQGEAS